MSLYIRVLFHIACHCIALLDAQFSNVRTPQSLVSEMAEYSKPDYKLSEMYYETDKLGCGMEVEHEADVANRGSMGTA